MGLLLLAAGFLVLSFASRRAIHDGPVWPTWLVTTYLLHVFGELFLSPVGLSSVTKLAPARLAGQMMGVWFLAVSLGNLLAGLFAAEVTGDNTAAMPARFLQVVMTAGGAGLLLLLCAKPIRKLMSGVK
jgi:POT family proton-dependent oligopeptide transporter